MKQYKKILFLIVISSISRAGHTQSLSSKDSLLVLHIHQLSVSYGLSSSNENAFLFLERQLAKSIDSIGKQKWTPEQRNQWLTNRLDVHDRQLRSIMTTGQWGLYTKMLQDRHNAFIKYANGKNIKVGEIKRDSL